MLCTSSTRQRVTIEPSQPHPRARRVYLLDAPRLLPLRDLPLPFHVDVLGWDALLAAVPGACPSGLALVDPFTDGDAPDERVRALVAAAPLLPVVALVPLRRGAGPAVRTLLEWGVSEVADGDFEADAHAVAPRLLRTHALPFKRRVEGGLSRFTSLNALTLIRAGAETAVDHGGAVEMASVFDASERTVAGWCAREGLPPPRRLLAWLRALLAVALLEEPSRSVLNAAQCAGYASDAPLRRALRELLGHDTPPRELAFDGVMAAMNEELRDLRDTARRLRSQRRTG